MKVPYASLQRWLNTARQQNECNQCGKCFAFPTELDTHIKSKHSEMKKSPEIGRKSGKEFKANVLEYLKANGQAATVAKFKLSKFKLSKSTLRVWSILDKDPFSCPTCDFKAPSQSKFARHMCKFAEQQNLECSVCELRFGSGLQLRKRLKKVHNQNEEISEKGNKNDFLQSMKIPQKTKYSTGQSKIPEKSPKQIMALNEILKDYTGADLTGMLKKVAVMDEPEIRSLFELMLNHNL